MRHSSNTAFHVLWTKPSTGNGEHFGMNAAEILTMVLSALMWQKHNGSISLYTDKTGYEFLRDRELLGLWDGGVNTEVLETTDYPIDAEVFWAAGKLIALEKQAAPCVMLDTDLIVTRPLHKLLKNQKITALHPEELNGEAYLSPEVLKCPRDFSFPAFYNWEVLPSNTAFLYIADERFKDFYVGQAKRFMFHNTARPMEMVSQMVFAEQRLLSICADYKKIAIQYLLPNPFSTTNETVVHLWGFKGMLRQNENLQAVYCKQLIKTLGIELEANSFFQHYVQTYFPEV